MLCSGFVHIATVLESIKKELSSETLIKKKMFWPKHAKAQTASVRKGASIYGSSANDLNLVALADIKHASMMLTNWSTTVKNGCTNKRRVGLELVEFECVEAQTNYYYGRHTGDDKNNNRKGFLSLEEVFLSNGWNLRQFGHVVSTCQPNSHVGNATFSLSEEEKTY